MAKKVKLFILGGDERYLEVIDRLAAQDIQIHLEGYDELTFSHPNISNNRPHNLSETDAVLLPLNGTDPEGGVEAVFSEQPVKLTREMLKQLPDHCVVYTGISTPYLDEVIGLADKRLVSLTGRDDVAILNSIPTAEAALALAIEETDYTIHGADVMVLGFGRVGMTTARLFSSVGAHVKVAVRKDADAARIMEMGMEPLYLQDLKEHLSGTAICINTVPRLILNESVLTRADQSLLIIDLASRPGGTDFEYARSIGIKALHALGLPGKTAPKTAGQIISNVLFKLL